MVLQRLQHRLIASRAPPPFVARGPKPAVRLPLRGARVPCAGKEVVEAKMQDAEAGVATAGSQDEAAMQEQQHDGVPDTSLWKWEESDGVILPGVFLHSYVLCMHADALRTYGAFVGILLLGNLPFMQSTDVSDLPYFCLLALITIYIGAHRALTTNQRQMISIKEGALAPVLASVSLFGCYLLVKYLPDFSLQTFLNAYFWLLGSTAALGASGPLLRQIGGPLGKKSIKVDVPEGLLLDESTGGPVTKAELAPTDLLAFVGSIALATFEVQSNHGNFTLNNAIACLIATDILQLVGLRSFRTAGLMLAGLLAYDVFWVFGSPAVIGDNVMMAVATSDILTGPVRIIFPRTPGGIGEASDFPFSLLGLGDIAIPGLLACLALRYDASRVVDMKARALAAGQALLASLAASDPQSSSTKVATDAADAAGAAYDVFADRELQQRERTTDGTNAGKPPPTPPGAAAVAPSQDGAAKSDQQHERVPVSEAVLEQRPYFSAVAGSYLVGLLSAFAANSVTHMGQPALLYIVPATLGTVIVTALSRDELSRVWQYTDVATYGMPAELMKKADEYDRKAKEAEEAKNN